MNNKIKILTVQFDVTGLSEKAIARLTKNITLQGDFSNHSTAVDSTSFTIEDEFGADLFNVSVREVDTEDV